MVVPSQLTQDIAGLRREGFEVELHEAEPRYYVILKDIKFLAPQFQPTSTDLMMIADYQYPQSRLDMFWTDPPVLLADGRFPQAADNFEEHAGKRWQRWSWHYSRWDPGRDNLRSHLEVFFDRISRGV